MSSTTLVLPRCAMAPIRFHRGSPTNLCDSIVSVFSQHASHRDDRMNRQGLMVTEEFWALFSPEQQAGMRENSRKYREAGRELFAELHAQGFAVQTMDDLKWPGVDVREAVPSLLKWYPRIEYKPLQIDIVGTLGRPWGKAALKPLLADLRRRREQDDPELLYSIGEAISHHAGDEVADELLAIAVDSSYGAGRAGIILGLSKLKKRRGDAISVLRDLLADEHVRVSAVDSLGMTRATEARDEIAALRSDDNRYVRDAAREALRKIDRSTRQR